MARVLVTEKIADVGLDVLRDAGHEVDVQLGLSPEDLLSAMEGAAGILVRSATTVDADVIAAAGGSLVAIGRAGVGLDNVDVAAATAAGVLVANAPTANSVSAAEHTLAMLLASARNIPQANQSMHEGRWERSSFGGVELFGKTLGIVGLGNIGRLVAERAAAFGMTLVAHDPFVDAALAESVGAELLDLEEVVRRSDFLTLHLARTPQTVDLINAELLASCAQPNLRIVNVARGGIVNEADLAAAIQAGTIAGAALDVFAQEPLESSPLLDIPQVIVTPHLGASTGEAQARAGQTAADQIRLALAGDEVTYAVNAADVSG